MPSPTRIARSIAVALVFVVLTGPVEAQSRCRVSVERTATSLEYRPIPYGGEVDIRPTFVVDCGAVHASGMKVTEHLPVEVQVVPGFGTPADKVVDRDLTWSIDLSGVGASEAVTLSYRLYVLPEPRQFVVSPTVQIDWPMDIDVNVGLDTERHAGPGRDPLVVQARPGARGCQRAFEHRVDPPVVDPGEPFTVDLSLHVDRCAFAGPRHRAVVAIQPPRDVGERAELLATVRTLLGEIAARDPGQQGMAGLYVNTQPVPVSVAATVDRAAVLTRLAGVAPDPSGGADAAAALDGVLAMLADWPEHHEVVYLITHASAARADDGALRAALARAAAQGAEVVPMCVGGGCDPALGYRYEAADLPALRRTIVLWEIPKRAGGTPTQVRQLEVDEILQSYVHLLRGSTRPTASERDHALSWTGLSIPADGTIHVAYRARIDAWGRFPVGASGVVRYENDAGHGEPAADLLLPAFVTVRRRIAGDQPCRVEIEKTVSPSVVYVGEPVTVTLGFRPYCEDVVERMHVVLSLDRSGSMASGDTEYAYVKFAARALAEMLAVETTSERRFGLISHGDPPVIEVPLTNDPDLIVKRIDAMVARGQDNLARSIDAAAQMLRDARPPTGARPAEVIVVLSDGGQTHPAPDAIPPAERARADGIAVVAACARTRDHPRCDVVAELASAPAYSFELTSVDAVLAAFVDLGMRLRQVPLREATVTDDLPPHIWYVAESAVPPARSTGRSLMWRMDALAALGGTLSYRARPLLLGTQPVNAWAEIRYTDATGRSGQGVFGVPSVTTRVRPPSGPCSALVDHRVTEAASVRVGRSVTLTMTVRTFCPQRTDPIDVVLVVDCSSTMRNYQRMANAKAAVGALLDSLVAGRARAGLIGFTDEIVTRIPLTDDLGAVRARADELRAYGGTDIAPALQAAFDLLHEGGWVEGTEALVVLLTDGVTQGSSGALLAVADRMKAEGVTLSTFCAGSCDSVLPDLASRPDLAFSVSDSSRLVDLYRSLLRTVRRDYAHDLSIVDTLSPLVDPLEDTFVPPPAAFDWPAPGDPATSTWLAAEAPAPGLALTYAVVPRAAGKVPVAFAELTYLYGRDGIRHRVTFPVPVVDVAGGVAPTPTPVVTATPTLTPEPTETPTATATEPGRCTRTLALPFTVR